MPFEDSFAPLVVHALFRGKLPFLLVQLNLDWSAQSCLDQKHATIANNMSEMWCQDSRFPCFLQFDKDNKIITPTPTRKLVGAPHPF